MLSANSVHTGQKLPSPVTAQIPTWNSTSTPDSPIWTASCQLIPGRLKSSRFSSTNSTTAFAPTTSRNASSGQTGQK